MVKTVVVMRNPKDMLVSLYYFYKTNQVFGSFDKSWNDFFQLFQHKKLIYGDWLDHVESYWNTCMDKKDVLFVQYEDAKADLNSVLRKIAGFLEIPLNEDVIKTISTHVEFSNMKTNPMTNLEEVAASGFFRDNNFIRQGIVGGWKCHFTVAQNEYIDEVYMKGVEQLGISIRDA